MNIVVMGAGAVGGYFGGKLANKGFNVTFLVRQNRYAQLDKNGLRVKSVHGDFSLKPKLATKASEIESPDIVLLALKNYHLSDALTQVSILVENGAKVLPLLNGIHHIDLLVSKYGHENVIGGLCQVESTLSKEGEIVQTSQMHDIIFGALTEDQPAFLHELKDMIAEAGLAVTLSDSIIEEMWKKYIFITTLSGITTALRQPIGVALQDEVTLLFLQGMVDELYQISKAKTIALPTDTIGQIMTKLQNISPEMTSSMHRDLDKGFPLELKSLHGAALEMAREHKVAVPNLQAIYSLLHPYMYGEIKK